MPGEQPSRSPILQHDPRSHTIYVEWKRGVVHTSVYMVKENVIFDLDEDGSTLGYEIYVGPKKTLAPKKQKKPLSLQSL